MQKRQISDIQKLTGLYTENTLETYFKKRNEKDTIAWVKEVTTGIDPKFSLLKTESVDAEQLKAVYDLGMRIKELQRAVEMRGLNEVFMLEYCSNQEDEDMENFLPCVEVVGNILKEYSKVTLDTVRKCVRYTMEYREEHLVWGLTLTFRLMEQCCEPELRSRVNERFMTIPIEEQGGPTYFKIAMDCITSVSYNISLALINKVDHMRIRNYEGENVLTAVSFLRGALNRLEMSDDLPKNIVYKVLNIMQTSSNHRFNNFFAQWYMQLDTTCKGRVRIEELITVDEILEQATRQYNILLEENRWIIAKKKGAGFNANNNEPSAQTVADKGKNKGTGLQRSGGGDPKPGTGNKGGDGKRTPKWSIPPGPGEPTERMWKNKPEYWCEKCNRWRRHSTREHTDNPTGGGNGTKGPKDKTVTFSPDTTGANSTTTQGILRRTGL